MQVSSINTATTAADQSSESRVPVQTLDQNDFLKLIVAQLANQDPMNPEKDTDFIAQMANFSSLEQAKQMSSDIAAMRSEQQLLQANDLIGRVVDVQTQDGVVDGGTVTGVQVEAGVPKLVVDGQAYTLDEVFSVAPTVANTTTEGVQP
jgi:flagellar basal-body rod modification protein FlgD